MVAPNSTVQFYCYIRGIPAWIINDVFVWYQEIQNFRKLGFTFNETEEEERYHMGLEFPAGAEYNTTNVSCYAGPGLTTDNVMVTIAGKRQSQYSV